MSVPEISVEELARLRDAGAAVTVVDVREPWEVAVAALPGSTNVPMRQLAADPSVVPRTGDVVVMCHAGGRSERVVAFLVGQGYANVRNLVGGIDAWSERIDPTVPRY